MCPQTEAERKLMQKIPYRKVVGGLLYLVVNTWPDIAYAVSEVSKYCQDPGLRHWKAVKRILRYLKGTADYGILLGGDNLKLIGYTDADWAGDVDSRRSMSGFLSKMGMSTIQWKATGQKCVTLSTFGSEVMALVSGTEQTIWAREFLKSAGFPVDEPMTMLVDNRSAVISLTGLKSANHVKHVGLRIEWLKEKTADKSIKVNHVNTADQSADVFTKGLGRILFLRHRDRPEGLNMKSADDFAKCYAKFARARVIR